MPNCSALYNHECVTINGIRKPCCRFLDSNNSFTVKNSTIEQYHSSDFVNDIKNTMMVNWHKGCMKCKNEEDAGLQSLRNLYNLDHSYSNNIESIEFSLSNKCNLICRMCGPRYSTKWETFLTKHNDLAKFALLDSNTIKIEDIFSANRDLSHIKTIKYLGGEPFITPEIYKMFKILDDRDLLKNITFLCSTNATLFPYKYVKYLEKFKHIRMHISLDGIGQLNEYIRYGKSWNTIINVLDQWKLYKEKYDNITLDVFTTIQAYNAHNIDSIVQFSNELNFGFRGALLTSPSYLSINALPKSYIDKLITTKNQQYFRNYQFNNIDFDNFKEFTQLFDKSSNMYLKNVVPELWKEIQQ